MISTSARNKFAVVIPIGPGEQEFARVHDVLDSLETYERGRFCVVLVDDAPGGRDLRKEFAELPMERVTVLRNPRRGRGFGWEGACTPAIFESLRHLVKSEEEFVLKLDTDALIIAPFADRVSARFAEDASVGMLGSRYFADGTEPDREWVHGVGLSLEKLLRPFALWRRTRVGFLPAVQIGLWGNYKRVRNVIRSAFINGYRVGDHCQGGGYVLSSACVRAMEQHGHLDHPCAWLPTAVPADDVQALCVKAVGMHYRDFGGEGEPFASHWRGMPDTPENLIKRGAAIIHSVKDHADRTESETRAFFRKLRHPNESGRIAASHAGAR